MASTGLQRRQPEAHRSFAPWWTVRFEQCHEEIIRVMPDRDRLTVIIANQFTCADERFFHARDSASSGLFLESISGDLLSVLPSTSEDRI